MLSPFLSFPSSSSSPLLLLYFFLLFPTSPQSKCLELDQAREELSLAEASLRAAEESLAEKEREIESVSLKLRESDADLERLTKGKRWIPSRESEMGHSPEALRLYILP